MAKRMVFRAANIQQRPLCFWLVMFPCSREMEILVAVPAVDLLVGGGFHHAVGGDSPHGHLVGPVGVEGRFKSVQLFQVRFFSMVLTFLSFFSNL